MKEIRVRITTTEEMLGLACANPKIYEEFIASKAPKPEEAADELEALVDATEEFQKQTTVFPRDVDGTPIMWDYQIKGFFKDSCGVLRKVPKTESAKIKAYKKEIDGLIFPAPRKIRIQCGGMEVCQRPLRAQTAQGERIALASSECIPAGAVIELTICCMDEKHVKAVREWLNYGVFRGLGQWRNSGKGRFFWEELDEKGKVIGGNKDKAGSFAEAWALITA